MPTELGLVLALADLDADALEKAGAELQTIAEVQTFLPRMLAAVLSDTLYIHTDRIMAEPVQTRTQALLEAMPDGT